MQTTLRHQILRVCLPVLLVVMFSCGKDDDDACDAEARTVAQAGQLYARVQSTQNCLLYKKAIQDYLNSACSERLTSSDRLQLQNIYNNLPC